MIDLKFAGLDELKNVDGRRVLLMFTDGDDTDSRTGLGTVTPCGLASPAS